VVVHQRKTQPRIALFIPTLEVGGTERTFLNLATGLLHHGYITDIILKKKSGEYLEQFPAGINLVDLNAPRISAAIPGLIGYLRSNRPQAIISGLNLPNLAAIIAKKLAGVDTTMIATIRSVTSQNTQKLLFDRRLERWVMRLIYGEADKIVAVSHGAAVDFAQYISMPLSKIRVIYNPTISSELRQKACLPVEHSWFSAGAPPVILSVGRLNPVKNYELLIQAFRILLTKLPARLLILGEGEQRRELENLICSLHLQEDVSLPGYTANPYAYMSGAAVFVLSSLHDALPNVLIEAMACDCPVVSTDCPGGVVEILNDGRFGHLVPTGNAQALTEAMMDVLVNKNYRKPDPGWLRQFDSEHVVKQYLELL
jgi:glycosyltransferase involved in cell wall biosynthesis